MKKRFLMRVFIAGTLLIFASTASFSQSSKSPEERAKQQTEKMKSSVSLNENQYDKVYQVNLEFTKKMDDLRNQQGSKEDKKESFRKIREQKKQALSTILSQEQMEKLKAMHKEHQHQKGEWHKEKAV
jgi:hypothetical protein